ncbi:MAG: hypothetical protein ACI90V_003682, partial [Bacillariaceae sp.]
CMCGAGVDGCTSDIPIWLYPIYKQKLSIGTQQILTQQLLFHIVWFTGIVDIT